MEAYDLEQPYSQFDDEPDYEDDDTLDYLIYDDGYIEQVPRWTRQRVVWFVIATVIILAMVGLLAMPLLQTIINPVPTYMPIPATPPSQL
jgi:hypothetical protein